MASSGLSAGGVLFPPQALIAAATNKLVIRLPLAMAVTLGGYGRGDNGIARAQC
jgi:hypothetical protein